MAQKRLSVRKIREILRLHFAEACSLREIGQSVGQSPSVVHDCLARHKASGLGWPLPEQLDDVELETRLYRAPDAIGSCPVRLAEPDYEYLRRELFRKGVTLMLLWQEYKQAQGDRAYQYSRFCDLYRRWAKPLGAVMHHEHKAGDKVFVDWSGDGIPIVDRVTGEISEAPLFVAVLGASGYCFAKAAPSRAKEHWLRLHNEMLEHFEGVPAAVVPDNEKTGVTSPCRYDPELNVAYQAWAEHYATTVIPTRPRKPRDKAMVENAVLNAQRWIVASLRNHTFFSVEQANEAIEDKLTEYNERKLQHGNSSRRQLWESIDRPALRPLAVQRFEPFESAHKTLQIDYHLIVEEHHYSAPYIYIGHKLEVRWTASVVEIFLARRRIAVHARSYQKWGWTTCREHRPEHHNAQADWSVERMVRWANKTGPCAGQVATQIFGAHRHYERGLRSCLGLMRLEKTCGADRLEAACRRALDLGSASYRTVCWILKQGADRLPIAGAASSTAHQLPLHENIRGPEYYS